MNTTTADARPATVTGQPATGRLRRSAGDERMLAGVAAGIARYLNADVTLVRVIVAALVLFTGAGPALYLAAWLLIPADGEEESIAAAWIARRQHRSR
jgi:phage shock protein C